LGKRSGCSSWALSRAAWRRAATSSTRRRIPQRA
jgi:hypothetical protein